MGLAMTRLFLLAAILAVLPLPAVALAPPADASAQSQAPQSDLVPVAIDTALGRIVVALDRGRAPLTAANFLDYVEAGKLDGENFYRAMPYGNGGLIQGGISSDARKLRPPIAHEPM
jgi:peptidyl-prolyl cis-trans isomerase A (cyclophilin A)